MPDPAIKDFGRLLVILGIVLVVAGGLLLAGSGARWIGKLPGDFVFRRSGATVYVPIATCVLLSLVLTLLLNFFLRR